MISLAVAASDRHAPPHSGCIRAPFALAALFALLLASCAAPWGEIGSKSLSFSADANSEVLEFSPDTLYTDLTVSNGGEPGRLVAVFSNPSTDKKMTPWVEARFQVRGSQPGADAEMASRNRELGRALQAGPVSRATAPTKVYGDLDAGAETSHSFVDFAGEPVSLQLRLEAKTCNIFVWVEKDGENSGRAASLAEELADLTASDQGIYKSVTDLFGWDGTLPPGLLRHNENQFHILIGRTTARDLDGAYVAGFFQGSDLVYKSGFQAPAITLSSSMFQGEELSETALSTLVHELQHLVHFVLRDAVGTSDDIWFNELMSLMTEDFFAEKFDLMVPALDRFASFLERPQVGVSSWPRPGDDTRTLLGHYAVLSVFGGYMLRNSDDPGDLLAGLMSSPKPDRKAIDSVFSGTFAGAVSRWGAALLLAQSADVEAPYNLGAGDNLRAIAPVNVALPVSTGSEEDIAQKWGFSLPSGGSLFHEFADSFAGTATWRFYAPPGTRLTLVLVRE